MTVVTSRYLGYRITVTDNHLTVRTPDGRRLCQVKSYPQARAVVRAARKETRA
jgi:hypothetical protein